MGQPPQNLTHRQRRARAWSRRKLATDRVARAFLKSDWPKEIELGRAMLDCHREFRSADLEREGCPESLERVIFAQSCNNRLCAICAHTRSTKLAAEIAAKCEALMSAHPGSRLVFLTLTLRSTPQIGSRDYRRIIEAMRKLRDREIWRDVSGSAYGIEVTKTAAGWHLHSHSLLAVRPDGWLADQRDWAQAWHEITGDSYVVHIEEVRDHQRAAQEVAKYITKPSSIRAPEDLYAIRRASYKVRTWGTTGILRAGQLEVPEEERILLTAQAGWPCPRCLEIHDPVEITRRWRPNLGTYEETRKLVTLDRIREGWGEAPEDIGPKSRRDQVTPLPQLERPPDPPPEPGQVPRPHIDVHGHHRAAMLAVGSTSDRWRPVCGCGWRCRSTFGTQWAAERYAMKSHQCVPEPVDWEVYPATHEPILEGIG